MTKDELIEELENLAIRFSKGWHEGIKIDASDIMLFNQIAEALAQPEQEPVAWKLMPRDATDSMLKAMDECSTEGYDQRLYAGHAASVYMAAWDEAPTPPQRKPLTDEQIKAVIARIDPDEQYMPKALRQFARAIEAAHGIKEKNNE